MDLLRKALLAERYEIVSEKVHPFENEKGTGYTGVIVIGESDATFHTYEERGSIETTVNTCRGPNAGWITVSTMVREIAPSDGVYAHIGIVPIERAAREEAAASIMVLDCPTSGEFLHKIEDKVLRCYDEMVYKAEHQARD
jgi:S-adenosylmethionine/arginine decarboxylase-like enzyme